MHRRHGLHGALGRIVVDFQEASIEIGAQLLHPGQGVADRLGELGFARDPRRAGAEPGLQIVEDRPGAVLPKLHPLIRRAASTSLLDGVQAGDPLDRLLGNDRALGLEDIDELAADMGHTGNLTDAA